jgi:hypothetical protein
MRTRFVLGILLAVAAPSGLANKAAPSPAVVAAAAAPAGIKADDVMSTLERLGEMKTKGILTQEEFDAKKAELLKKLT